MSPWRGTCSDGSDRTSERRRLARGLSQEGFADLLGVHRTYMGGLERGERNVTLRTVERLAQRLGVPADELLGLNAGAPPGARRARP